MIDMEYIIGVLKEENQNNKISLSEYYTKK